MALGRTQLNDIAFEQIDIDSSRSQIEDCLNTFQYVVNSLTEWADETTVGSGFKTELSALITNIENLENENRNLIRVIDDFKDRQYQINERTGYSGPDLGSER